MYSCSLDFDITLHALSVFEKAKNNDFVLIKFCFLCLEYKRNLQEEQLEEVIFS
jgi:hypothetical protein